MLRTVVQKIALCRFQYPTDDTYQMKMGFGQFTDPTGPKKLNQRNMP